jgi:hypothetical protein
MNFERVARTLVGAAALSGLLVIAGCNHSLSSGNSGGPPGGTPIASVKAPGDWGASLLAGGTVGVGMFPAKFTFDVNAPPSCANDYVAFNSGLAGASPTTNANQGGNTFSGSGIPNGTLTIKHGATSLALTAGSTFAVVNNNSSSGTGAMTNATSLAAAIASLGGPVGVTAMSSGPTVTITALTKGSEGNAIALSSTLSLFTVGGPALTGGLGTGNIVAFNNLYATQGSVGGLCNKDGPSVYWSYYTGTGTAVTSIVLSGDGTKGAFVENVGTNATLRILKWNAGEGTATGYPVAPTNTLAPGSNWSSCPAGSCMSSIAFSGGPATDTKSSPFYVYTNNADVLYAGDDSGRVHKFTGVFNGTPAEVTTGWPITVNAGAILTSPIYDSSSGNMFVGDSTGSLSYIREVGSTVGSACTLPCLGTPGVHIGGTGGSIDDAPVVDGSTGLVLAINSTDGTNFGTILQADTALTVLSQVSFKIGGSGTGASSPIYSGAFDNIYITSAVPNIAGHMYVCGKAAANRDRPAVYQLSFAATGILTGVGANPLGGVSGDLVSASGEACSPVTEIFNPNTSKDWIFFSIGNNTRSANPIPIGVCTAGTEPLPFGCVLSADVTGNPAWPPGVLAGGARTPGNAAGSTSGFVVDNAADITVSPQASSFYFTLGTNSTGVGPGVPSCNTTAGVGCAVKLTQGMLN